MSPIDKIKDVFLFLLPSLPAFLPPPKTGGCKAGPDVELLLRRTRLSSAPCGSPSASHQGGPGEQCCPSGGVSAGAGGLMDVEVSPGHTADPVERDPNPSSAAVPPPPPVTGSLSNQDAGFKGGSVKMSLASSPATEELIRSSLCPQVRARVCVRRRVAVTFRRRYNFSRGHGYRACRFWLLCFHCGLLVEDSGFCRSLFWLLL